MNSKSSFLTLTLFVLFIIGQLTFMVGFFPISYNVDHTYASESDLPQFVGSTRLNSSHYKRQYEKIVLMVIDAMRFDFVTGSGMNYVKKKISKSEACLHKLKVEAPTVTMPRIKSLTTGTLSNFIDVVLNFGSMELQSDSILYQMFRRKDKVYFYGDNTWTKLFPGKFYMEYANNDSFFVHDFYSGDKKITQDVFKDVNDKKWDFLILHYLGLDHIGHIEGPNSEKMPSKLAEMDDVINKLVNYLDMNKSIVLVTADHGMRNSGGHGGNSNAEVIVPLLIFNTYCKTDYVYNQIDFAPTFSVLMGLPIPEPSIGCIITELIHFMPLEDQLYALYYNNKKLIQKAIDKIGKHITKSTAYTTFNLGLKYHEEFYRAEGLINKKKFYENTKFNYVKSTRDLSDTLASKLNNFDIPAIIIGTLLSTITNVFILFGAIYFYSCSLQLKDFLGTALLAMIFCLVSRHFICDLFLGRSQLCQWKIGYFIIYLTIFLWFFGIILYFQTELQCYYQRKPFMLSGTIIYTCSLLSSSFIEEEHQTWYYLVETLLIYLCMKEIERVKQKHIRKYEHIKERKNLIWDYALDFNGWFREDNPYKRKMFIGNEVYYCSCKWAFVLIAHVFIRRLNQTGDKWIHLSDVGDWFNAHGNEIELNILCLSAVLLFIICMKQICNKPTAILSSIAACIIILFRFKFGVPLLTFWLCILAIYVLNILLLLNVRQKNKIKLYFLSKSFLGVNVVTFSLITMLLHKPHNMILVPAGILTLKAIFSACNNIWEKENDCIANKTLSALWIGKMFFFYQGNSNNLASVDLNPGFIGLNEYNFYLAAKLIALNTFSGPISSLLLLFHEVYDKNDVEKNESNISDMMSLTTLFYSFPACAYLFLMVLFRSHLFIWSVFSPKFLYEITTLCVVCIIMVFYLTLYKFLHRLR